MCWNFIRSLVGLRSSLTRRQGLEDGSVWISAAGEGCTNPEEFRGQLLSLFHNRLQAHSTVHSSSHTPHSQPSLDLYLDVLPILLRKHHLRCLTWYHFCQTFQKRIRSASFRAFLKVKVLVAQQCLTLQLHGLQPTRLLWPWNSPGIPWKWVAIPFSRRSSQPRDLTQVSCI